MSDELVFYSNPMSRGRIVKTGGADLALELSGRQTLVPGVAQCEAAKDYVSREILVSILADTEEHIDYLEKQLELIEALGDAVIRRLKGVLA